MSTIGFNHYRGTSGEKKKWQGWRLELVEQGINAKGLGLNEWSAELSAIIEGYNSVVQKRRRTDIASCSWSMLHFSLYRTSLYSLGSHASYHVRLAQGRINGHWKKSRASSIERTLVLDRRSGVIERGGNFEILQGSIDLEIKEGYEVYKLS